jgi:signal transduction histidine kinase
MKRKLSALSQRYVAALEKHVKRRQASLKPARGLGQQAVKLGLETLDIAKIHDEALAKLEASSSRDGFIRRARIFFDEAVTPIEKTHRAALRAKTELIRANATLERQTADLAISSRVLKESIARRQSVEKSLKRRGGRSKKLLVESGRLEKHLRTLAHEVLTAQEKKRQKISHDLQDEIAQTLLGINVRLLTLKRDALVNAQGLKKAIATTQRLVDKSVRSIRQFARECAKQ